MGRDSSKKSQGGRKVTKVDSPPEAQRDVVEPELWVVIETDKDFCVVEFDCIENPTGAELNLGDKVHFFWSKSCKPSGVIKFFNGEYASFSV